jgi:predicted nucleic-acid-binding Zn-ribbon protein
MSKYARCIGCKSICFREERTQNTGVKLEIGINQSNDDGIKTIRNVISSDKSIRIEPEVRYFCEKCGNEVWITDEDLAEPVGGGLLL